MSNCRDPEEISQIYQAIIAGQKLVEASPSDEELLEDWVKFYQDVFQLKLTFNGALIVPARKPGFDRLLVLAKGMTPQRLYDKCDELFPSWKYTDSNLDEVIKSDRTAKNGHYAVWVRNRQEADEENWNFSADQLKRLGTPEITLEEREVYELKFFKETDDHMDKSNRTLCPGSRHTLGNVPSADWGGGGFGVDWHSPGSHCCRLRSRSVVSLPA
ncbi:MAG: hypothetical protein A2416_00380 [Candidatus Staskawiczbacteria bacterium RIFOXYC1_FULL_37_52]|nr:MAG: hypothetical protein A2416_00380 [Candidatus Staskawiczbacteria bacterium RIFOXYC1_FULL_37_52]OGZ87482.1 MAG: hypothetical protein A2444_02070 [Candidatus Staskawiczbacteria bacterium RIFOXYC2_FULL_37_19]OGZ89319.1 MAG: hypothetical protein A2581_00325 [Candidatus Staskawiczbacteria bacterium RIFOXYD1_FULL_37_110]